MSDSWTLETEQVLQMEIFTKCIQSEDINYQPASPHALLSKFAIIDARTHFDSCEQKYEKYLLDLRLSRHRERKAKHTAICFKPIPRIWADIEDIFGV